MTLVRLSEEDVLLVFCDRHRYCNFTTVVGWYRHMEVLCNYQEAVFENGRLRFATYLYKSVLCRLESAEDFFWSFLWIWTSECVLYKESGCWIKGLSEEDGRSY